MIKCPIAKCNLFLGQPKFCRPGPMERVQCSRQLQTPLCSLFICGYVDVFNKTKQSLSYQPHQSMQSRTRHKINIHDFFCFWFQFSWLISVPGLLKWQEKESTGDNSYNSYMLFAFYRLEKFATTPVIRFGNLLIAYWRLLSFLFQPRGYLGTALRRGKNFKGREVFSAT